MVEQRSTGWYWSTHSQSFVRRNWSPGHAEHYIHTPGTFFVEEYNVWQNYFHIPFHDESSSYTVQTSYQNDLKSDIFFFFVFIKREEYHNNSVHMRKSEPARRTAVRYGHNTWSAKCRYKIWTTRRCTYIFPYLLFRYNNFTFVFVISNNLWSHHNIRRTSSGSINLREREEGHPSWSKCRKTPE